MKAYIRPIPLDHENFIVTHLDNEEQIMNALLPEYLVSVSTPRDGAIELDIEVKRLMGEIELYNRPLKPMQVSLKGEGSTRRIWLFNEELTAQESLFYRRHSTDGFGWGYEGSGPAQLSLAICIKLFGVHRALKIYQRFKTVYISNIKDGDFEIDLMIDHDQLADDLKGF